MTTILSKWKDAIGGHAAVDATRSLYIKSAIKTLGLEGTMEEWWTLDGRHRLDLDLGGVFRQTRVYDDGARRAWITDQNGHTREVTGDDMRELTTEAYFATHSQLLEGRMKGAVTDEDSSRVTIAPEAGLTTVWYLDDTGLPHKSERREGDLLRTTVFSEWRDVDGLRLAFQRHESTEADNSECDITVQTAERNGTIDDSIFAEPGAKAPDYRFVAGPSATRIPIDLFGNHVFVKAQANDAAPAWFLVDTGAQISALDADYADRAGVDPHGEMSGRGAGEGSTEMSFGKDVTFRLPGVELSAQTVAIMNITERFGRYEGRAIDGILGYDFLSRFVVEIDYANARMNVHDPAWYEPPREADAVPMMLFHGIPSVTATIKPFGREPLELKMLVDTGAVDAVFLNRPLIEEHALLDTLLENVMVPIAGVGGESKQSVGRLEGISFGRQNLENPVTYFAHDAFGAFANPDFDGIIGGEILRRYTVAFDYAGGRMILTPHAALEDTFEFDRSGVVVTAEGERFNEFRVHGIIEDSPGAEAGLDVGDVIVDVGGIPAAEMTLAGLRREFATNGRNLTVTVQRGGDMFDTTLRLRRLV